MSLNRVPLTKREGFTLIELMISTGFLGIAALIVSGWISTPQKIQTMLLTVDAQTLANNAANIFVGDLQKADPSSVNWNAIPPTGVFISSITFSMLQYSMAAPTTPTLASYVYSFQPTTDGVGSLVRKVNGVSNTLLTNVITPTTNTPLVQQDTSTYNMLIVSFSYQSTMLHQPITVTRRVAITS
jgi:prepilin-type N-terminal cleavage/methylation domain-containing protein